MMDDAGFRDRLQSEFGELLGAVRSSEMFLDIFGEGLGYWIGRFASLWDDVENFALASGDAAEEITRALGTGLVKSLAEEADESYARTVDDIRDELDEWQDSKAADNFRDHYLRDLQNALVAQYEYAIALRGLIELQWGLLRAAREAIIEICQQTTARIKQAQIAADRQERERLASLVPAVFGTIAGTIAGGPVGGVVAAISGFGGVVAKLLEPNKGATPEEIYSQMISAIYDLTVSVRDEQDVFIKGVRALEEWTSTLREDMLPPAVVPDLAG